MVAVGGAGGVRTALLSVLMLSLACAPSDNDASQESSEGIQHPRPEYLAYRDLRMTPVRLNDASAPTLPAELTALSDAPVQTTVGGDSDTPFEDITALLPLPDGALLVVDKGAPGAHLIRRNGDQVRIGRAGQGPGEFRRPTGAALLPGGRLVIADVMRRLETFTLSDNAVTYTKSFHLPFSVLGMCSIGEQLYTFSAPTPAARTPIRVLNGSMEVVDSFGEAYQSPNEMVNTAFAEVAIVCDRQTESIVLAPRAGIGEVYVIKRDGTPRFKIRFEDYLNREILEDPDGSMTVGMNEAGVNRLANAAMLRPGVLLLQYEFLTREDQVERSGATGIRSLEVDLASASVTGLGGSLPVFVPLGEGRHAVRMNTDWPGIELRGFQAAH